MNLLPIFGAELAIIAAGLGLAGLLRPARPVSLVELTGLTLLLGQMVLTLALFGLGAVLRGPTLIGATAIFSLILGGYGLAVWRRTGLEKRAGQHGFFLALLPVLLLVGWQAVNHPLSADGLFNFEMRAQFAAQNGGWLPVEFYSDPSRQWTNLAYPLFLPLTQTWIYLCLGAPHQALGQLLTIHFTAAAACLLFAGVTRLTGETWRGGLAVALLFLLPAAMVSPGGACTLWADFPSAIAFLGALLYLVEYSARGQSLGFLAACLGLIPWVKREGIILAAILVVILAFVAWRRRELRRAILALIPVAVIVVGWKIFLLSVHTLPGLDAHPMPFSEVLANAHRVSISALALLREFFAWERWSLLWPLAVVAIFRIARLPALQPWRLLIPAIIVPLVIYTGLYVFTSAPSVYFAIASSLQRLMLPVAMPALLAIAVAVPPWRTAKKDETDS